MEVNDEGLLAGGGGEFESLVVGFAETFLGGGFGGPVEVEVVGGPPNPNFGWDIRDAAVAATRPA